MPEPLKTIREHEAWFKMRKAAEFQSDEVNRKSCLDLFNRNSEVEESLILQVLDRVEKKIDSLERRLDLIFKEHVLINGVWCNITNLKKGFKK